jgi:type IV secretory pathway TraG/TraD family ATPase VirD4
MDSENDGSWNLLWIGALLGLVASLGRIENWIRLWLRPTSHRLALAIACAVGVIALASWLQGKVSKHFQRRLREKAVLGPAEGAVYCGRTKQRESVYIKPRQRAMHTQVIGTTNAGKTESVILPWAIQDIQQGRGLVLIDGKADRSLLDKLWAYTVKHKRESDFRLFSLSHIEESHQFNPLIGGSPEEVSERVFNSFEFENPHYRSLQFEVFSQVMRIFDAAGEVPTFLRLHQAISYPDALLRLTRGLHNLDLRRWAESYRDLPNHERAQRTSGLTAALSHFAFGKSACLFNTEKPAITLENALENRLIVYFQLPVLLSPFLGKAAGMMILQCLQGAVANRHRGKFRSPEFYSVFLDDFAEYLYPGFVSILNKSRSANVGIVFAHQALGDIKTLGDPIANSILTNANLKVFMRGNDPDSAEYFAKVIGTVKATKFTERRRRGLLKDESTGDKSAREVEEFIVHPNRFKTELGIGEAVMVIPHESGSRAIDIKFRKFDDLPVQPFHIIPKKTAGPLRTLETKERKSALTQSLNKKELA